MGDRTGAQGIQANRWRSLWFLPSFPVAALLVLTRAYPTTDSDAGIFLSVAGRLLAGDRLYRDVFDNKDPLFYFSQSLALWVAGWRGPFLLDIVWLTMASVGAHLLLRELTDDLYVAVYAQVAYPLLVTALHYSAAYSETPGLSLLPLFAYFAYRRRCSLAGCAAGAILLLRVSLLPVIVAIGVVALPLVQRSSRARLREWLALLGGTAAGVSLVFLVLALRGELGAYFATLRENLRYASYALKVEHWPPGIRGHLRITFNTTPPAVRRLIVASIAFTAGALVAGHAVGRRLVRFPLLALTVMASVGTLITLATTTLWDHHVEVLAFPLLCATALGVDAVRTAIVSSREGLLGKLVLGFVTALCLAAALFLRIPSASRLDNWFDEPQTSVSDALVKAARASPSRTSYFHLGENDEMGQGAFLGTSFRLACPRFHQYPWTSPSALRATTRCLRARSPQLIAVTPSFRVDASVRATPPPDAWKTFVIAGNAYVNDHCRVAVAEPIVRVYRCH